MTTLLRTLIISLFVAGIVMACADHQLRPVSPLRMRLKTLTFFNAGNVLSTTGYNYDANNRVTSFTSSTGEKGEFEYDEQNRYKVYNYTSTTFPTLSEATNFVYNTVNNNFKVFIGVRQERDYTADLNRRVLGYTSFQLGVYLGEIYEYTGDNITVLNNIQGRTSSTIISKTSYEFDNQPNPFYGLIGPGVSSVDRFSRNNVTKSVTDSGLAVEYIYEYNAQGLPSKRTEKNGLGAVVYTYESY